MYKKTLLNLFILATSSLSLWAGKESPDYKHIEPQPTQEAPKEILYRQVRDQFNLTNDQEIESRMQLIDTIQNNFNNRGKNKKVANNTQRCFSWSFLCVPQCIRDIIRNYF